MILNQIMAVLLPSIIDVKTKQKRVIEIILNYIKALLIVNFVAYIIIIYITKNSGFVFTNEFTVQYMIIAIIVAVIYPIIGKAIQDNIEIKIEVEKKNEEKN